jgi:hypothetical protein
MGDYTGTTEVDFSQHPNAQKLLSRVQDFLDEVENLTPGRDLEAHLNKSYGPGNPIYEDLCDLTRKGLEEGWVANIELDGTVPILYTARQCLARCRSLCILNCQIIMFTFAFGFLCLLTPCSILPPITPSP